MAVSAGCSRSLRTVYWGETREVALTTSIRFTSGKSGGGREEILVTMVMSIGGRSTDGKFVRSAIRL